MEEKIKKEKFLQIQFCMLLLVCTLLPDWGSIIGLMDFDIPVFCCKIIGAIVGLLALYSFYKSFGESLPVPFLAISCGGFVLVLLSLIPGMPGWLDYLALIALLVGFFLSKKSLNIQWSNDSTQGAYLILISILLHIYNSIDDTTLTGIMALVGLILYIIGLAKLKKNMDAYGLKGISRLKVAVILGIIAVVVDWIPIFGWVIAGVLMIVSFVFEFLGYNIMKQSSSIGDVGRSGAGKLCVSMIILVIGRIVDFFPLTDMVVAFISLISLWFVFKGWSMILFGLEESFSIKETKTYNI